MNLCIGILSLCVVVWILVSRTRALFDRVDVMEQRAREDRELNDVRAAWCKARIGELQRTAKPATPYRACGCQCHEGER